jgi:hypothetical protein
MVNSTEFATDSPTNPLTSNSGERSSSSLSSLTFLRTGFSG